jgi:hypothetical protein
MSCYATFLSIEISFEAILGFDHSLHIDQVSRWETGFPQPRRKRTQPFSAPRPTRLDETPRWLLHHWEGAFSNESCVHSTLCATEGRIHSWTLSFVEKKWVR